MAVGAALILSALVLLLHNRYADARAGREAETLLAGVEAAISQGAAAEQENDAADDNGQQGDGKQSVHVRLPEMKFSLL